MEKISEEKAIEMLFECLFTDYYLNSLNDYEKEKVYLAAMNYQFQLFKPKLEFWKNRNKHNLSAKDFPEIEEGDIYKRLTLLIAKLNPIVGSKRHTDYNSSHYSTHEKLYEALIFSANEEPDKPIEMGYDILKKVWYFINSDSATFNGIQVEKFNRPLKVNPYIVGKPVFDQFFEAEISFSSTQNQIKLTEADFNSDISNWIKLRIKSSSYTIPQKRKFEEFLEFVNSKSELIQPIGNIESRTKRQILKIFADMDKRGWQYAFLSEQDYNLFTNILTHFFEYTPYSLPQTPIQLKRSSRTKIAKALGEIHRELSNENKLRTDKEYFKLIRVLSHFEKQPESDLYKALTR